jgi:hypothetical protein
MVGSGLPGLDEANSPGIFLRRGAVGTYANMIVMNFASTGAELTAADGTAGNLASGETVLNGILLWNNGLGSTPPPANTVDAQIHSAMRAYAGEATRNFMSADPMLRRPMEMSDPDLRPLPGSPVFRAQWSLPAGDDFLEQSANYIGAIGEVNWTEEWANFLQENDLR